MEPGPCGRADGEHVDGEVAAGIELHHRTDSVFHQAPVVPALMRGLGARLERADRGRAGRGRAKAGPFAQPGSRGPDVGCADGAVVREAGDRIASGVRSDLHQLAAWVGDPFELRVGEFPDVVEAGETFDAITMLAVVEHAPRDELEKWAKAIPDMLVPGGPLVITTPSPKVDEILHLLIKVRLIDGMEAHEHYGFDPGAVPEIFGGGRLQLAHRRRFQLGLNHLFVFRNEE